MLQLVSKGPDLAHKLCAVEQVIGAKSGTQVVQSDRGRPIDQRHLVDEKVRRQRSSRTQQVERVLYEVQRTGGKKYVRVCELVNRARVAQRWVGLRACRQRSQGGDGGQLIDQPSHSCGKLQQPTISEVTDADATTQVEQQPTVRKQFVEPKKYRVVGRPHLSPAGQAQRDNLAVVTFRAARGNVADSLRKTSVKAVEDARRPAHDVELAFV